MVSATKSWSTGVAHTSASCTAEWGGTTSVSIEYTTGVRVRKARRTSRRNDASLSAATVTATFGHPSHGAGTSARGATRRLRPSHLGPATAFHDFGTEAAAGAGDGTLVGAAARNGAPAPCHPSGAVEESWLGVVLRARSLAASNAWA